MVVSLLSLPAKADHVFVPLIDNYAELCVLENIIKQGSFQLVPSDCYCIYDKENRCVGFLSQEEGHEREVKRAHERSIAEDEVEKAFNRCMFKNIKPNSNSAHRRVVRKYCEDLVKK